MDRDQLESLREQLLDIVENRLIKRGYRAMSMQGIAAAAGISKKTLYTVFESKEDMALQVVDRVFARLEEEMANISTVPDPLERFRQEELVIVEIVTPIDREDDAKRPVFWRRIERFAKERRQHLTDLFREAQEKGLIRASIRPEIIALMYNAAMKALVDPDNRMRYSYSSRAAAENALEVFLEGLKPD